MLIAALLLQAAAPRPDPCYRVENHDGTKVIVGLGDRICVDLLPPRRYTGIWINDFEGQAFVEGANVLSTIDHRRSYPWFNTDDPLKKFAKPGFTRRGYVFGHGYKVSFIGREARVMDRPALAGYGHFGMSPGLVMLDEMLSIEDLGPMRE